MNIFTIEFIFESSRGNKRSFAPLLRLFTIRNQSINIQPRPDASLRFSLLWLGLLCSLNFMNLIVTFLRLNVDFMTSDSFIILKLGVALSALSFHRAHGVFHLHNKDN
jgi:hypothetical protein